MEVIVLYTEKQATLGALRTAAQLAQGLEARIQLLAPLVVPYPLPLETPSCDLGFLGKRFRTLAGNELRAVDTFVEFVLCRDVWDGLQQFLGKSRVIVIGKRKGWWPKAEDRLARRLQTAGHHIVRSAAPSAEIASIGALKGFRHA